MMSDCTMRDIKFDTMMTMKFIDWLKQGKNLLL